MLNILKIIFLYIFSALRWMKRRGCCFKMKEERRKNHQLQPFFFFVFDYFNFFFRSLSYVIFYAMAYLIIQYLSLLFIQTNYQYETPFMWLLFNNIIIFITFKTPMFINEYLFLIQLFAVLSETKNEPNWNDVLLWQSICFCNGSPVFQTII